MGYEDLGNTTQYPATLDSSFLSQNLDGFSPEELAWADSCLNKDPDDLNCNFDSLKDTLWDIIDNQPLLLARNLNGASSTHSGDDMSPSFIHGYAKASELTTIVTADDVEIPTIGELANSPTIEGECDFSSVLNFRDNTSRIYLQDTLTEGNKDGNTSAFYAKSFLNTEDGDILALSALVENDSVSSLEAIGDHEATDEMNDVASNETENAELLRRDIFKVWDLCIHSGEDEDEEDDEFASRLNKALSQHLAELAPATSNYNVEVDVESIDDLTLGIENLSLNQIST